MIFRPAFSALLALCLCGTTTATASTPVTDLTTDSRIPYDGIYNRLTTHMILYSEGCAGQAFPPTPYGFLVLPVAGDAARKLGFALENGNSNNCEAVAVERGVARNLVSAVMANKIKHPDMSIEDFIELSRQVEVCFLNYVDADHPLDVKWINPADQTRKDHIQLHHGERKTRCFTSFIGHRFEVFQKDAPETVIAKYRVEFTTVYAFGEHEINDFRPPSHDFDAEIAKTLNNEWGRHQKVTRTFSSLGFAKGRLPDDVFASMSAFFHNNREHAVLEEWGGKGVFVNWWETDCSFIQIPWQLKGRWQERLRLLVEEWAGVPIEQTDMYGLRRYEEGARLLTHVDRVTTHAVSLIVNIAQSNLTEPWPVEVFDHEDRLHEVIMEPGDIVYYESAKALHSRNRPLKGKHAHYVNLFTHYRPTGDPDWYSKPNPANVPEPVGPAQGDCRLEVHPMMTGTPGGQLGQVQTVVCDDPRLGRHLSPTLFQAKNADDLIEWWRRTAPNDGTNPTCATTE